MLVQKALAVEDTWELWLSEFGVNADVKHSVGSNHAPPLFHPPSSLNVIKIMFWQSVKRPGSKQGDFFVLTQKLVWGFLVLLWFGFLRFPPWEIMGRHPLREGNPSSHMTTSKSLCWPFHHWAETNLGGFQPPALGRCREPKHAISAVHSLAIFQIVQSTIPIVHWQDELCLLPLCCAQAVQSSFQPLWVPVTPSWTCFFTAHSLRSTLRPYKLQSWSEPKKSQFIPVSRYW